MPLIQFNTLKALFNGPTSVLSGSVVRQTLPASNVYVGSYSTSGYALITGSYFRVTLGFSNPATASTTTVMIKYGMTGTISDTTIHNAVYTGTANADVARVLIDVHVDSIGASNGAITVLSSMIRNLSAGATGFHNVAGTPVATSQSNTLNASSPAYIGLAVQGTAATTVLLYSMIERVK